MMKMVIIIIRVDQIGQFSVILKQDSKTASLLSRIHINVRFTQLAMANCHYLMRCQGARLSCARFPDWDTLWHLFD